MAAPRNIRHIIARLTAEIEGHMQDLQRHEDRRARAQQKLDELWFYERSEVNKMKSEIFQETAIIRQHQKHIDDIRAEMKRAKNSQFSLAGPSHNEIPGQRSRFNALPRARQELDEMKEPGTYVNPRNEYVPGGPSIASSFNNPNVPGQEPGVLPFTIKRNAYNMHRRVNRNKEPGAANVGGSRKQCRSRKQRTQKQRTQKQRK